jgi:hypothetical protein
MGIVKGDLHRQLQALLHREWKKGTLKQESLSVQMENSQNSVSAYLRGTSDAGALDLDEADAALRNIGSSLLDFLSGVPPRELTATERLAIDLDDRPHLKEFVADLMPVPKTQLGGVLDAARGVARIAIELRGERSTGQTSGRAKKSAGTKSALKRRPKAPADTTRAK